MLQRREGPKNLPKRKLIKKAYKDGRSQWGGGNNCAVIYTKKKRVRLAGLHNEDSGVHIIPAPIRAHPLAFNP